MFDSLGILVAILVVLFTLFVFRQKRIKSSVFLKSTGKIIGGNEWRFPLGDVIDNVSEFALYAGKNLRKYAEDQFLLVWIAHMPLLTSFSPELNKQIVTKPEETYQRELGIGYIRKVLGRSLLGESGENWKRQHRILQKAFSPNNISLFFPVILQLTKKFIEKLDGCLDREIDLSQEFHRLSIEIITKVGFGSEHSETQEIAEIFKILLAILKDPLLRIPGYSYLWFLPQNRLFHSKHLRLIEISRTLMERRRKFLNQETQTEDQETKKQTYLIDLLLSAKDDETSKGLSDQEVIDNTITFLVAGSETTATALSWFVYNINRRPEILNRLRDEIEKTFPANNVEDFFDSLTPEKITIMSELPLMILESLRYHPPVAILAPRITQQDLELGGWNIPKGFPLNISIYLTHRSDKNYENPDSFKPDRWKDGYDKQIPYTFVPFGAGRRSCIGKYLALLELKICLTVMFKLFDFEIITTEKNSSPKSHLWADTTPPFIDVEWVVPLLHPKGGVHVKLKKRL